MNRETRTATDVRGGCFACGGADALWTGRNAMAVAARHHDATGHETWSEQVLSVRYGASATGGDEPGLFDRLGEGAPCLT